MSNDQHSKFKELVQALNHEETMIKNKARLKYIEGIKQSSNLNPISEAAIQQDIANCNQKWFTKLNMKPNPTISLLDQQKITPKQNWENLSKIEEDIRAAKLKEIKKKKEMLEQKLEALSENEKKLSNSLITRKGTKSTETIKVDQSQKALEASKFIQQIQEQDKKRRRREKSIEDLQETKKRMIREMSEEKKKQDNSIALLRRKEETMITYQLIKHKREIEQKALKDHKITVQSTDNYLYKRLENRYNQEVVLPMLNQKKELLAMKRNKITSLKKEELKDHIQKYEQIMTEKEQERIKTLNARKQEELIIKMKFTKFKTPTGEKISKEDSEARLIFEKKKTERIRKREKMIHYASLVKESVPVPVSAANTEGVKKRIELLKHPVRQSRDTRKQYDLALLNKRNMSDNKVSHSTSIGNIHKENSCTTSNNDNMLINRGSKNSINKVNKALQSAIVQQHDYLAMRRKRREESNSNDALMDWKNDLINDRLNPIQKYDKIVQKAQKIEEQAKMKEKVLKAQGQLGINIEKGEGVSELFVEAIKAKLAILEDL